MADDAAKLMVFQIEVDSATGEARLKGFKTSAESTFRAVKQEVDKTGTASQQMGKQLETAVSKFSKLTGELSSAVPLLGRGTAAASTFAESLGTAGLVGGIVVAGAAVLELGKKTAEFFSENIHLALEAQDAWMGLTSSFVALGASVESASAMTGAFEEFGAGIQKTLRLTDEAVAQAGSRIEILTHLQGKALEDATRAAIGLSGALGRDVGQASILVSRTLEGNVNALARMGIRVDLTKDAVGRLQDILRQTEPMFRAQQLSAGSLAGRLDITRNAWQELREQMGLAIVQTPALTEGLRGVDRILFALADDVKALAPFVSGPLDLVVRVAVFPSISILDKLEKVGAFLALYETQLAGFGKGADSLDKVSRSAHAALVELQKLGTADLTPAKLAELEGRIQKLQGRLQTLGGDAHTIPLDLTQASASLVSANAEMDALTEKLDALQHPPPIDFRKQLDVKPIADAAGELAVLRGGIAQTLEELGRASTADELAVATKQLDDLRSKLEGALPPAQAAVQKLQDLQDQARGLRIALEQTTDRPLRLSIAEQLRTVEESLRSLRRTAGEGGESDFLRRALSIQAPADALLGFDRLNRLLDLTQGELRRATDPRTVQLLTQQVEKLEDALAKSRRELGLFGNALDALGLDPISEIQSDAQRVDDAFARARKELDSGKISIEEWARALDAATKQWEDLSKKAGGRLPTPQALGQFLPVPAFNPPPEIQSGAADLVPGRSPLTGEKVEAPDFSPAVAQLTDLRAASDATRASFEQLQGLFDTGNISAGAYSAALSDLKIDADGLRDSAGALNPEIATSADLIDRAAESGLKFADKWRAAADSVDSFSATIREFGDSAVTLENNLLGALGATQQFREGTIAVMGILSASASVFDAALGAHNRYAAAVRKAEGAILIATGIKGIYEGGVHVASGIAKYDFKEAAAGALEIAKGAAAVTQGRALGGSGGSGGGGGGSSSGGAGGGPQALVTSPRPQQLVTTGAPFQGDRIVPEQSADTTEPGSGSVLLPALRSQAAALDRIHETLLSQQPGGKPGEPAPINVFVSAAERAAAAVTNQSALLDRMLAGLAPTPFGAGQDRGELLDSGRIVTAIESSARGIVRGLGPLTEIHQALLDATPKQSDKTLDLEPVVSALDRAVRISAGAASDLVNASTTPGSSSTAQPRSTAVPVQGTSSAPPAQPPQPVPTGSQFDGVDFGALARQIARANSGYTTHQQVNVTLGGVQITVDARKAGVQLKTGDDVRDLSPEVKDALVDEFARRLGR